MKKMIMIFFVLSFFSLGSVAMASNVPSILQGVDTNMYQKMSDNQLSQTIGEKFVIDLDFGHDFYYWFRSDAMFGDDLVKIKYNRKQGFTFTWTEWVQ